MKLVIEVPSADSIDLSLIPSCIEDQYTQINKNGFDGDFVLYFFENIDKAIQIAANISTIAGFIMSVFMVTKNRAKVKIDGKPIPSMTTQKEIVDLLSKSTSKKSSPKNSSSTSKKSSSKNSSSMPSSYKPTTKKTKHYILEVGGQQIDFKDIKKKAAKLEGDIYIVVNEKKLYNTAGESINLF